MTKYCIAIHPEIILHISLYKSFIANFLLHLRLIIVNHWCKYEFLSYSYAVTEFETIDIMKNYEIMILMPTTVQWQPIGYKISMELSREDLNFNQR